MIELQNVSFSIEEEGQRKDIIKDISLKLDNKFIAITGPNGSGKSTLAKLIMGLEKPSKGRIFFKGEDITDLSVSDTAKTGMSSAFQPPAKFKGSKVFDLISLGSGRTSSIEHASQ